MKKRVWILYDEERLARNRQFAAFLTEACAARGMEPELVMAEEITCGICGGNPCLFRGDAQCDAPELVIRRCVVPRLTVHLELMGVRVCNGSYVSDVCNDKALTAQVMRRMGVRTVDSLFVCGGDQSVALPWGAPYIVKPTDGHGGVGVSFAANASECLRLVRESAGQLVVQPYVECGGSDVRVYVLGGRVLRAMKRTASEGFRSNFCLGGSAVPFELTAGQRELAESIAAELRAELIGVDFLPTRDGLLLNEIEDVVGTRMLYSICSIDAAAEYVEYLSHS